MLRISKLTDYATLVLNHLSTTLGQWLSANAIAQQNRLSRPTVSKILKMLLEAGLVTSSRGVDGGYQLAQSANQITLAQIITAMEGPLALVACTQDSQICAQNGVCALQHNWHRIHDFILTTLNRVTLADMSKPLSLPAIIQAPNTQKLIERRHAH